MGRSVGLVTTLIRLENAARQAQAARTRAALVAQRQADRARKAQERARLASAREQRRAYVESRLAEVAEQNDELNKLVTALESILSAVVGRTIAIDLDAQKEKLVDEPFDPGPLARPLPRPDLQSFLPPPRGLLSRLVPGGKAEHELQTANGNLRYEAAVLQHASAEKARLKSLEDARLAHEAKVQENRHRVEVQHADIEALKAGLQSRDPEAVAAYLTLVLGRSEYPEHLSRSFAISYDPDGKRLSIVMDLPGFDSVPETGSFKYVKAKDEIEGSARPARERRALYQSLLAQMTLRTIYEVFSADSQRQTVDTVSFEGFVSGIDSGTGQRVRSCVVRATVSPDVFQAIELRRVDPVTCIRTLHGSISKSPAELVACEAAHGLNIVDPRFMKKLKASPGVPK